MLLMKNTSGSQVPKKSKECLQSSHYVLSTQPIRAAGQLFPKYSLNSVSLPMTQPTSDLPVTGLSAYNPAHFVRCCNARITKANLASGSDCGRELTYRAYSPRQLSSFSLRHCEHMSLFSSSFFLEPKKKESAIGYTTAMT